MVFVYKSVSLMNSEEMNQNPKNEDGRTQQQVPSNNKLELYKNHMELSVKIRRTKA